MSPDHCKCPPPTPPFDAVVSIDCPLHGTEASALVAQAIDTGTLIQAQPAGRCELCSTVAETRPYGPQGEDVCFECAMKDEPAARRAFANRMAGDA